MASLACQVPLAGFELIRPVFGLHDDLQLGKEASATTERHREGKETKARRGGLARRALRLGSGGLAAKLVTTIHTKSSFIYLPERTQTNKMYSYFVTRNRDN